MEIAKQFQQGTLDVTLTGSFTFNDHQNYREILQKIEEGDVHKVVLHLQQVDFIDSAALGMLLLAQDAIEHHNKSLVLSGAVGQVKKMFDLARFEDLFTIV
jgi:anti-anti-sigma factor